MNQITNNKLIAKNSLYLYIRMGILMIISLLSIRLLLKSLGIVDYGIYSAVGGLVVSFSFISQTLVSASQRFFAIDIGKNDKQSLKQTYDAILLSFIIIVLIVFVLLETFGLWFISNKMIIPIERYDVAKTLYQLSICTFITHILTNPYNALIIAYEDMKTFAYISLLEGILKLLAALSLFFLPADRLLAYPILLFCVSLIIFLCYFIICYKRYECITFNLSIDFVRIKSVFSYSSWTIFGTMASVANNQGLNILLNIFFGPIINAAYSISVQVNGLLNQLANSFFSAVRPPLIKSYATEDKNRTYGLFIFSSKVLIILLSVTTIPLFVFMEEILNLWLGEVDEYMIIFSKLSLVAAFILAISTPITTIIQAAGAVKLYHGIVDSWMLLTLPLSYLAFKLGMKPQTAFLIMISIIIIAHIIRLLILKKYFDYSIKDYSLHLILPSILISLSISITCNLIYRQLDHNIISIILVMASGFFITLLSSYFLILNKSDRKSLINLFKR